mgnify:FL=1|jgi:hypothetical protein|tara:strand:- start:163 stop:324 length:162 start_codon:yes stop_codon:yes gene_type:complete
MRDSFNGCTWRNRYGMHVAFTRTAIAMWVVFKNLWRELTNSYEPSKHYFKGRK